MSEVKFKKIARQMSGGQTIGGYAIILTTAAIIVTTIGWASWTKLDRVTRGPATAVSALQNQRIQAAEGGVILQRYVSENSIVQSGDILFELDPVDANSELNRVRQRRNALAVKELRLRAEINGEDLQINNDLAEDTPEVSKSEMQLFQARRIDLVGRLSVLNEQLGQRRQTLQSSETRKASLERTAGFLMEEIAVVEPLVKENIAPVTRLLALQRELEQTRNEIEQAALQRETSRSGITEMLREIENTQSAYRLRAIGELNDVVAERSELLQALPRLEERVTRTTVRAPMDGVVNRLNYRTPGGFVKSGDVLLELVPTRDGLLMQGKIQPKDISRIRVGDFAHIRLSAYDSSRYGTLDGEVIRISPDAIPDETGQGGSHYLVDVEITGQIELENGQAVEVLPGMTGTVDVVSGKRTVLDYFWQPIARVQELALRD